MMTHGIRARLRNESRWAVIVVPLLAYGYRISVEERVLRARFGPQFDAYARVRWRLSPCRV